MHKTEILQKTELIRPRLDSSLGRVNSVFEKFHVLGILWPNQNYFVQASRDRIPTYRVEIFRKTRPIDLWEPISARFWNFRIIRFNVHGLENGWIFAGKIAKTCKPAVIEAPRDERRCSGWQGLSNGAIGPRMVQKKFSTILTASQGDAIFR